MKKNNIPLNFREKNNSRISLLCSAAVLIVLVFLMHQLDYGLITKPEEKATQEAQKKEEEMPEEYVITDFPIIDQMPESSVERQQL